MVKVFPPAKRPKLNEQHGGSSSSTSTGERYRQLTRLGQESYASKSAIESLRKSIKKDGVPEAFSRRTQYRARKATVSEDHGGYGPLVEEVALETHDGETLKVGFQNPQAMLYRNCGQSVHDSKVVKEALAKYPCSAATPWNLVLYQDGVDPSDGLAKNHSRKSNVFYDSFLEFGAEALCHEQMWGTIT